MSDSEECGADCTAPLTEILRHLLLSTGILINPLPFRPSPADYVTGTMCLIDGGFELWDEVTEGPDDCDLLFDEVMEGPDDCDLLLFMMVEPEWAKG
jgi:hypothetical protein